MTQEDKSLLLQDLCARLPYGVIVGYSTKDNPNTLDKIGEIIYIDIRFGMIQMQVESGISYGLPPSEFIKPYLRPMSSMSEKEKEEYYTIIIRSQGCSFENGESATTTVNDWLLSKHFDVRGLISKGLAIAVTKENNPYGNS